MGATRHVLLNGSKIKGVPKEVITFLSTWISNLINFSEIKNPMFIYSTTNQRNGFSYYEQSLVSIKNI